MASRKIGEQTLRFSNPPVIVGWGNIVGSKEHEGALGDKFDEWESDQYFGQDSWEKAEVFMQRRALSTALAHAKLQPNQLDLMLSGDLLNQCISSSFASRDTDVPFLGLYNACATMSEALGLAAVFLDGGFSDHVAAMTSSHFCCAERQYRMPLSYGGQRCPSAQWTATAAGAVILAAQGEGPRVTGASFGRVVDWGITDQANMGAAMAPAAYDSIIAYLRDTSTKPEDYDIILTGDLGFHGADILRDFLHRDGLDTSKHQDCGMMLYNRKEQDVHAGGSGAGCSAAVLTADILPGLKSGSYHRVLFCATGALLSPLSTMQNESIPGVCHVICLEGPQ